MTIEQYEKVRLKDGRIGTVVEVFTDSLLVDVGDSPSNWDTISVDFDEVAEKIA